MLDKVLETCQFVTDNPKHVKINYNKTNELINELLEFKNVHYLANESYGIYNMCTKDIVNFLLIYNSIDFSFWGKPKWTINANGKEIGGSIALLRCILSLFKNRNSEDVYQELERMTLEEFSTILKGNIDIPLLEKRYEIVIGIAKIVNNKMNGDFYDYIKDLTIDKDIFKVILDNFPSFEDTRTCKGKKIYFYKLAQLLTSNILHVIENKEKLKVDYSNLVGCADYKIPQVMQGFGILEYDSELNSILQSKIDIEENSSFEVEIRASMIVVINYIYKQINKSIDRIDINDFVWGKGQDKTKQYQPYHLTRTTSY